MLIFNLLTKNIKWVSISVAILILFFVLKDIKNTYEEAAQSNLIIKAQTKELENKQKVIEFKDFLAKHNEGLVEQSRQETENVREDLKELVKDLPEDTEEEVSDSVKEFIRRLESSVE